MSKFKFAAKLSNPKTFSTKNCSIEFEIVNGDLVIQGSFLDYNWDKEFRSAVDLLKNKIK